MEVSKRLVHTEEEYLDYVQVYLLSGYNMTDVDLHQRFADLRGISRQEAKALCYTVQYSIPFLKPLIDDVMTLKVLEAKLKILS